MDGFSTQIFAWTQHLSLLNQLYCGSTQVTALNYISITPILQFRDVSIIQYPSSRCPGGCLLSPWDFLPKVLVVFFRFLGKWEHRAEACSGDNVGCINQCEIFPFELPVMMKNFGT